MLCTNSHCSPQISIGLFPGLVAGYKNIQTGYVLTSNFYGIILEYRTLCDLASVICMHLHYPSLGTLILLKDLCMTSFTHGNMIKLKVIQVYMTPSFVQLPRPGFTMKCSYSLPELLDSIQLCTSRFTKSISSPFSVYTASVLHVIGSVTD